MKVVFALALLALGVKNGDAACANGCSRHGTCGNYAPTFATNSAANGPYRPATSGAHAKGYSLTEVKKDSCTCFLRNEDGVQVYDWTGFDCSLKTCPSGPSIGNVPIANNDHAQLTECSGVGDCDRSTGTCKCQPGYTGKSCSRRQCPNDCSGKGKCVALDAIVAEVASLNANLAWVSSGLTYTAWDKTVSHGCLCDAGYRGPDCSIMECPSSTDPMGGWGSESGRECSGRGLCNTETGACECFPGYSGTSCDTQSTNLF